MGSQAPFAVFGNAIVPLSDPKFTPGTVCIPGLMRVREAFRASKVQEGAIS